MGWRSEADFDRRMAVVAYDVLTQATAKIKGGLLTTGTKARASLRSPRLFFVLVAPASSSLERPHGAQKNPKLVLGAFDGLEVRSGRIFGFRCVDNSFIRLLLNPCCCWACGGFW